MKLRVTSWRLFRSESRTRIPFGFGAASMRKATICLAELEIETEDGRRARGFSSDLLVPKDATTQLTLR